jgi:transmembrane sensor
VAEFGKTKARVQLQRGRAHLSITKGLGRAWAVEAGPFAVNVTGTQFSVDWQPEEHRMEVVLHEGSVVVTGACLGGERRMVAPDRFVADCDKKAVAFSPEPAELQIDSEPPTQVEPMAPSRPTISWRQLAKAGKYEEALANAKRAGFPRICKTATAAELLDLGDAARLAGDTSAAEQALTALHSRFPHTPQSALASFNLGRLAFDQRRNFAAASIHFSRYISEEPAGALVGDAWGRLLEARSNSQDPSAATKDARTYLERFPNGPYSPLARRLIQNAQP